MTTAATHHHLSTSAFMVPDKILVASDLTDIDYLIPHAISQCKACAASLVLGHVIPPVESESLEQAVLLVADVARREEQKALNQARRILGGAAEQVRAAGIDCEVVIRRGHPRDEIAGIVGQVHAGRVILGTHGRRNLKKFFLERFWSHNIFPHLRMGRL